MFLSIRRKHLQLFSILSLLSIVSVTLFSASYVISEETSILFKERITKLNYFDVLASHLYKKGGDSGKDEVNTLDPVSYFNREVSTVYENKIKSDIENKFWLLDTDIKDTEINIPKFYYDPKIHPKHRPGIQPFDPRFTLAIYYNYIKYCMSEHPNDGIEVSFHWYDWLDMSILNKYLLAPSKEKPNCTILDARLDEEKMNQDNEKKKAEKEEILKQLEEEEKKKEEQEKQPRENIESRLENANLEKRLDKRSDAKAPADYCIDDSELAYNHEDGNKLRPGFNVHKAPDKTTPEKAIIAGKSYLYSLAPPPSMIIFLTKEGSYNVTINKKAKLLDSHLVNNYLRTTKSTKIDPLKEFRSLKKQFKSNQHQVIDKYEVHIHEESFQFKFTDIIKVYQERIHSGNKLSKNELKYFQSLKYSENQVRNGGPPKYFSEARILGSLLGDHYDWRFFNGIMYGTEEQALILHRLVRTWLSFTRKNGITTWVAHGSLLSWYWNGIAFPWDNDIDVQVPVMDLHKLSLEFNQTLIVEDVEDGFGRYFLDCGSFITLRSKGNGNNNIDARFIDIDSGLYIDITGLAISETKVPGRYEKFLPEGWVDNDENHAETNLKLKAYNCRNNHFSTFNELSPLIKTYIEGEVGYVPKGFTDILAVEYSKGLLTKKFSGHVFIPQLRLWIKEEDVYYFLYDKEKWIKHHKYNEDYINALNEGDDLPFEDVNYELSEAQKLRLKHEAELREKQGKDSKDKKLELTDNDLSTVFKFSSNELLELLMKDNIFMSYYSTRDFTAFHEEEIMRLLFDKSTQKLIHEAPDFKPMKYEPFAYKIQSDYIQYDNQVETYMQLLDTYEKDEALQQSLETNRSSDGMYEPEGG